VFLNSRRAAEVQILADQDPTRTCGCGDAFLGGALAWFARSVLFPPQLLQIQVERDD
jgi:hypothetical protein